MKLGAVESIVKSWIDRVSGTRSRRDHLVGGVTREHMGIDSWRNKCGRAR